MESKPEDMHFTMPDPQENEYSEVAWGIQKMGEKFTPFKIPRGKVTDNQVKFEMLYAGICHTDLHYKDNGLGGSKFPLVPGHELLG